MHRQGPVREGNCPDHGGTYVRVLNVYYLLLCRVTRGSSKIRRKKTKRQFLFNLFLILTLRRSVGHFLFFLFVYCQVTSCFGLFWFVLRARCMYNDFFFLSPSVGTICIAAFSCYIFLSGVLFDRWVCLISRFDRWVCYIDKVLQPLRCTILLSLRQVLVRWVCDINIPTAYFDRRVCNVAPSLRYVFLPLNVASISPQFIYLQVVDRWVLCYGCGYGYE